MHHALLFFLNLKCTKREVERQQDNDSETHTEFKKYMTKNSLLEILRNILFVIGTRITLTASGQDTQFTQTHNSTDSRTVLEND